MKTLAELKKELKEHNENPMGQSQMVWTNDNAYISGQISIMKSWHVEEMYALLKEITERDGVGREVSISRARKLLTEMEAKEGI